MKKIFYMRQKWLIFSALLVMSIFPVYRNVEYGLALTQYGRQKAFWEGNIEFYNPWQYRVLCPLICEGLYIVYTNSVDKILPIAPFFPDDNPEVLRYYVVFVLFRVFLHLAIFALCWLWYRHFVQNGALIFLGFALLTLSMGNAVRDSDFSFNTYVDVILYLCAGLVAIRRYSPWWILGISFVGALNRETALLIPFLYALANYFVFYPRTFGQLPGKNGASLRLIMMPSFFALLVFIFTAWAIRAFWGYRPVDWQIPLLDVIRFNLTGQRGLKTFFEIFGSLTILPWFVIWGLRGAHPLLKCWFWGLVPLWFAVHLGYTAAWESRLFLVPLVLILLPLALRLVEQSFQPEKTLISN